MGVVYRALDTSLERRVALKLLRKDHSENAELIAQLESEAAITASINHPNVVKVYSTGRDRGLFYIAMELVDKGSLDDLMRLQGIIAETQVLDVALAMRMGCMPPSSTVSSTAM
jgi:serine/threonine protein kinase